MKISRKKLPKEQIDRLRRVPVKLFEAHSPLSAPVYLYLRANQKFVALKEPLQVFSEAELEKFKSCENFYLPEFVDFILPFQKAGEAVRALLQIKQKRLIQTNYESELVEIPMPQFEKDNAVFELIRPLWGEGAKVEPFFLCFFSNEVCASYPEEKLLGAIDQDIDRFEFSWLRANAAVFLALHIGYSDRRTLTICRDHIFEESFLSNELKSVPGELGLLKELVWNLISNIDEREISLSRTLEIAEKFKLGGQALLGGRSAQKLLSKLKIVQDRFIHTEAPYPSLYGEKGVREE